MNDLEPVMELDRELIDVAKSVKVLSSLAWEPHTQHEFLSSWARGQPVLPNVEYRRQSDTAKLNELEVMATRAECHDHPLAIYVRDTALSYLHVSQMLEHLGEARMTDYSVTIYGRPGDPLSAGNGTTSLDAARYFLGVADEFYRSHAAREADFCISAQVVKQQLEARLAEVFDEDTPISVVIDATLASKAAAGANRIRLRDATCFSEYDIEQLLQHEAFVHSLTARNGRRQRRLQSLLLGAPRTTAAQEGLATFAELVTGAIDMARLERVALRVIAIDMALGGADFVEVFRYFLDAGQPESESYNSTVRVFRGAPVPGGSAFTKDGVYLHGLLEVHTFFRWALTHQRLALCRRFFAGRMTIGDVVRLDPYFEDGTIEEPNFLPLWMTRTTGLGGYLAFSVFANTLAVGELDADHTFERPQEARS